MVPKTKSYYTKTGAIMLFAWRTERTCLNERTTFSKSLKSSGTSFKEQRSSSSFILFFEKCTYQNQEYCSHDMKYCIVNSKDIPQKNGSHERMVYCSPASPDGPHPPHFATSVPILQHSGNHKANTQ